MPELLVTREAELKARDHQPLVTFLNYRRGVARRGSIELGRMQAITDPCLDFHADTCAGFHRMTDAAAIVLTAIAA